MVLAVGVALTLAACGAATPVASFDPTSACTTDGRMPGAYPELEALLPTAYEGQAPATVDSGRNCTHDALGSLADAGIDGVRFAGATWPLGGTSGLTVAVFEGEGLDPRAMIDFYDAGARAASRTEKLLTEDTKVAGQPARRLAVLRSDGSGQTILAWPDGENRVMVLLAADVGDAKVAEAAEGFAGP
jgi:hypothetical protein